MKRNATKKAASVLVAVVMTLASWMPLVASASAQTFTATLTGTVTDPGGAAVPNVKVVATNQGTKLDYTAQTSDSGVYTIPFLPVGKYVVTIEAAGFKRLASNEITLEVNQTARVDLKLQVGAVSEQVTVEGVAPILQTENITVGQVITGNTTVNLPLNGRNFQQLTLLVPGTINPNPGGFTGAGMGSQGRPYVNGNREQGNAFLLDGISVDETIDNRIGYKPNVDAIAEFRIETSNSSAEFGNVTGATVNSTLKSGTNDYHGNAFEFFRNDALDANTWSNNRSSTPTNKVPKQKLRQNIFGGTLGGPIMKNKMFFFMDYQGTKQRTGGGTTRTVAPIEWRNGNLSSLSAFIRDPQKPKTDECRATPTNPAPGVNYQAACFPGSIIPTSRFSPTAKALFADPNLYPLPTRAGTTNISGNYLTSTAAQIDGHQFDVKLDARLSDKDNFSGRYSFGNYENPTSRGALPTDLTSKNFSRPQNIALNWTRTFSPTIVNEARIGFNRAIFIADAFDFNNLGNANAKLGIPGTQAIPGLTLINLGSGLSGVGAQAVTEDNVTNTFHYGDNLSISRGRHYFKMGGQFLRYQQNRFYPGNNGLLGFFTYDSTFTGVAFADFLLDQLRQKGLGNTGGLNPGTWGHRQNRIGFFFQDDYKVRTNLTLNLGLRWEYTSPVVEVKDRQANFDSRTGKLLLAGKDGNSRALYEPYYKGFEPRIGFAWTPQRFDNRLVVRAGYGITQYMEGTGSNLRLPLNPPFFSEADVSYDTGTGPGTISTGFTGLKSQILPNGTVVPAGLIRIWNPHLRPQFTQQWNLTLEYQLNSVTSVSAAYVGHYATHLVAPTDDNQPLPETDPALKDDPTKWRQFNLRRPLYSVLPNVTQVSGTDSWAISRYNALQVSARQRYARGLEFLLSYTFSKTLTDNLGYYGSGGVSAQGAYSANNYNRHGYNYGPAFFDARHNFVISGTYDLPVGKGRRFGNNWNPAVNTVFGGWNVSSIISAHTGFPITIATTDRSLQNPRGTARPNQIGNPIINSDIPDCYIGNPNNPFCPSGSTVAFSLPALGTFGSAGVGTVRAPGYFNWDLGVGKKFNLTESKYFDFRAEFFNAANHPNFNPPDRTWTATSTTFGQITSVISSPRNLEFALKFHF
ncbi:MAG TPA: TonB-dependent receptor [Blastocatellia bacterium]|nr:TonB-dependent receptor [Blastocatellia bacterium]